MQGRLRAVRLVGGLTALLLLTACSSVVAKTVGVRPATSSVTSSAPAPVATSSPAAGPSATATQLRTGTKRLPDGRLQVTDTEAGFQLAVPAGYARITSRDQLNRILRAGSKALKGRVPAGAATAFAKNVRLFSVNQLTGSTISLVTTPANGLSADDLPDQADAIKGVLANRIKATSVKVRTITVDGLPGLRADGVVTGAGVRSPLTQIYAIGGDTTYVITLGGPGKLPEPVLRKFVASIHFVG